jgi:hypothetical protein
MRANLDRKVDLNVDLLAWFQSACIDFASGGQLQYGVNPDLIHFFT